MAGSTKAKPSRRIGRCMSTKSTPTTPAELLLRDLLADENPSSIGRVHQLLGLYCPKPLLPPIVRFHRLTANDLLPDPDC